MSTHLPHRAGIGERWGVVRAARDDEDGGWIWELDGRLIPIDVPSDFTAAVEPGVEVTIDYGRFGLIVWRDAAGQVHYRGTCGAVVGPERSDEELALWALLDQLGDGAAPRACFFCRWSEDENPAGTGWNHLGCVLPRKAEYDAAATSDEARRRKWGCTAMVSEYVDEWHVCDEFEVRPVGYGYRGRPQKP
jgi:hypothetical protein